MHPETNGSRIQRVERERRNLGELKEDTTIMAQYSTAVPLQFAIIVFPGKWVALRACADSRKGRATNVIAFRTLSNDFISLAMIAVKKSCQ